MKTLAFGGMAVLCMALGGCIGAGGFSAGSEATMNTASTTRASPADAKNVAVRVGSVDGPLHRDDCYTVKLFDRHRIVSPGDNVPDEYAAFLGRWTNGAWKGEWCHDLLITEVTADGRVRLVEMHAPHFDWNQPATAFKRTGRINEAGELRFAYGVEDVTYRLAGNGKLMAYRTGVLGQLRAELRRPD